MRKDLNLLKFKDISVSSTSNQKMGMALLAIIAIAIIGLTGFIYVTTSSSLKEATKKRDQAKKDADIMVINNAQKIKIATLEIEKAKEEKEKYERLLALLDGYDASTTIHENVFQYFMCNPELKYQEALQVEQARNILKTDTSETVAPTNSLYEKSVLSFKFYEELIDKSTNEYVFTIKFEIGGIYFQDGLVTPKSIDKDAPDLASNIYKKYLEKLLQKNEEYNLKINQDLTVIGGDDGAYGILLNVEVKMPVDKYKDFVSLFNNTSNTNLVP